MSDNYYEYCSQCEHCRVRSEFDRIHNAISSLTARVSQLEIKEATLRRSVEDLGGYLPLEPRVVIEG